MKLLSRSGLFTFCWQGFQVGCLEGVLKMIVKNNNKINRRIAFRIYEQVNLVYQKIEPDQPGESQPGFNQILKHDSRMADQSLPASQSQENDTLNVNISANGIAFTCKEALKAGDYLLIRMLLLSSMTRVMTCCKVVYCKPSNPYEENRYPYLVGAQFVNLTAEDGALLNRYINKRKKQQLFMTGLLVSLAMVFLAMPEEIFGLLLELGDELLDTFSEALFMALEYIGMSLEYAIEHVFNTSHRLTQIIGFYMLSALEIIGLLILMRLGFIAGKKIIYKLRKFFSRKKASFLYFWGQQTVFNKIKAISIAIAVITCYGLFAI